MAFLIKVLSGGRRFRGKDEDLEQLRKEFSLRKAELATALLASADVRSLIEMIFDTSYAETQYFLKAPTRHLLQTNKQVVWKILSQLPEGIPLVGLLRDLAQRHGLEAAPDIFLELQLILSELIANKTVSADLADTLEYGWQIGSPLFGKPSSFASQNRYQRSVSAPVSDVLSGRDAVVPSTLSQESKSKQTNNVTDTKMRLETPYAPSSQVSDFPSDRAGSSRFASRRMSYTGSEPASSLYTTDSDDDSLSTSSRMSLLVAVSETNETDSTLGSIDDVDIGSDVQQQAENENGFTSGRFQMRQSECTSTSDDPGFDQQEAHILSVPANSAPEKADTSVEDSSVGDLKLARPSSEPGACRQVDLPTTSTMEPQSCTANGAKDEAESSEANLPGESADSYDSDQQAEDKLPISSSVVLSGKYPESEFYTPEMWTYSGDRDSTSFEEGNELLQDTEKVKPEEDMPEDVKVMVVARTMNDTYVSVSVQPVLDRDEAGAQTDGAEESRGPSSFKTDCASIGEVSLDGGRNLEVGRDCTESFRLHSEGVTSEQEQANEQRDELADRSAVMHKERDPDVEVMQGKQQPSDLIVHLERGSSVEVVNREEQDREQDREQEPSNRDREQEPSDREQEPSDREQEPSDREQDTASEFMQKPSQEDMHRERAPGNEPSDEVMQRKEEQIREEDNSNSTVRPQPDAANTEEVAGSHEDAVVEQEPSEGQVSQGEDGEQRQPEAASKTDDEVQKETSVSETEQQEGKQEGALGEIEAPAPIHDRQEEGKPEVAAEQEAEPAGKRTSNADKERLLSGSDEEPGGESPKFDISLDTKDETAGAQSHGRRSVDLPHSGPIPFSGPIQYSGSIPYSGNLSLRSDSSTNSTRSFAFPVLHADWNSSPVKMPPPDKRFFRRRYHIWKRWCCCINCANH